MGWTPVYTHDAARPVKSQSIGTPLLLQCSSYAESRTNTSETPVPEDRDYLQRLFTKYRYRLTRKLSRKHHLFSFAFLRIVSSNGSPNSVCIHSEQLNAAIHTKLTPPQTPAQHGNQILTNTQLVDDGRVHQILPLTTTPTSTRRVPPATRSTPATHVLAAALRIAHRTHRRKREPTQAPLRRSVSSYIECVAQLIERAAGMDEIAEAGAADASVGIFVDVDFLVVGRV